MCFRKIEIWALRDELQSFIWFIHQKGERSNILEVGWKNNVGNKVSPNREKAGNPILGTGRRKGSGVPNIHQVQSPSSRLRKCVPVNQEIPEIVAAATVSQETRMNRSLIKPEYKVSAYIRSKPSWLRKKVFILKLDFKDH